MQKVTVALFIVLLLSSCSPYSKNDKLKAIQFDDRQIVFFSDDRSIHEEAVYYDALLDLKHDFPREIQNMKVFYRKQTDHPPFDIKTYPSLVVVENNKIIVHIKGPVESKDEIVLPLTKALSE
ncbi:hypothetical protein [Bacillus alveayuensis]|uniref:Small peptidoglycan-associated lipoprotein n=1 Tax=Aeribacillus alveayuensis TaxID=279215 RepID=A0ABT9VMB1_9BACI|nr:hypothetical protein [Bacillus alveayuensis]MDQ0162114.1 hypothetical protein [Bacillus alveayuensis]